VVVVKLVIRFVSVEMSIEVSEKDIERVSEMISGGKLEMLLSYLRDLGVDIEEIPRDVSLMKVGEDYLLTHAPVFG